MGSRVTTWIVRAALVWLLASLLLLLLNVAAYLDLNRPAAPNPVVARHGDAIYRAFAAEIGARDDAAGVLDLSGMQQGLERNLYADRVHYNGVFNDLRDNIAPRARHPGRPGVWMGDGEPRIVEATAQGYAASRQGIAASRYPWLFQYSYGLHAADLLYRSALGREPRRRPRRSDSPGRQLDAFEFIVKKFVTGTAPASPMVFVIIPKRSYYESERQRAVGDRLFDGIRRVLTAASIDLIDLRGALSAADYYYYDGHWRPSGHARAAGRVIAHLQQGVAAECLRNTRRTEQPEPPDPVAA